MTANDLLTINSLILAAVGLLLGVVGYFLRDLHKSFKNLVDTVSDLKTEVTRESTASEIYRKEHDKDAQQLQERLMRLEQSQLNNHKPCP